VTTAPKVALFGLFGSGNLGNEGSLDAMLRFLRTAQPAAELACVCPVPEEVERRFGLRSFSLTWYRPAEGEPRLKVVLRKMVGKVVDSIRTYRWVRRYDAVIVPGMGVLETTLSIRPWGFPYALLLVLVWGRLCGRKVALVSVGAEVTGQPVTRWVMKTAARLATYRSYRDNHSKQAMQRMGVDTSRDSVYPDLAFALPTPHDVRVQPRTVGVGVMAYRGTYADRGHADEIQSGYLTEITAFVAWLVDEGYRVRLFTGDPSDETVAAAVMSAVRRTRPQLADGSVVTVAAASLTEVIEQMAKVEVVVASRYHNVISALRAGRPTISISYATKNDVLMESVGLRAYCQPIRSLDQARLREQFRDLELSREQVTADLVARNDLNTKLLEEQNADLLATLFGKSRQSD